MPGRRGELGGVELDRRLGLHCHGALRAGPWAARTPVAPPSPSSRLGPSDTRPASDTRMNSAAEDQRQRRRLQPGRGGDERRADQDRQGDDDAHHQRGVLVAGEEHPRDVEHEHGDDRDREERHQERQQHPRLQRRVLGRCRRRRGDSLATSSGSPPRVRRSRPAWWCRSSPQPHLSQLTIHLVESVPRRVRALLLGGPAEEHYGDDPPQ